MLRLSALLYVFCGWNRNDRLLNSIEQFDTEADTSGSATQWNLISVSPDVLPAMLDALMVAINSSEILIMGGDLKSDVYVFNTVTQEVMQDKKSLKLRDSEDEFKFDCLYNQSYVTRKGEIIAWVED